MLFSKFIKRAEKRGIISALCATRKYLYNMTMSKIRPVVFGSYSQFGEDIEVEKLLGDRKSGFYVDVGANDPDTINNTKRFYNKGWRGINIEPNSNRLSKFCTERPGDINLNIGIAETEGKMEFYLFDPPELSTFSEEEAQNYRRLGYRLVEKRSVEVKTLARVLEEHAQSVDIDFLSVDTEGYDLKVLESNDWERFRPKVICVEIAEHGSGEIRGDIGAFLSEKKYRLASSNDLNGIYIDSRENPESLDGDEKEKRVH